jgi:crotonobetainyl-CoA:carnitine CoA-transferase CaiB-like acyl-CoA transferase
VPTASERPDLKDAEARDVSSAPGNPMAIDDLRVIDLTSEHGAYCGKLLAELGADVIKVEPPSGDPARRLGPFLRDDPGLENSLFFLFMNTGKRSMTLDLEKTAGREILHKLAEGADILVEDVAGERLLALGLRYETLRARNPRLIVTSMTPFGRSGPYRDFVASDLTIMGMAGALFGYGFPDKPPNRLPGHQSTILAGIHGAVASLTALYARDRTDVGQHVDLSMQDAIATASLTEILTYDRSGRVTRRAGMRRLYPATGIYRCADGYAQWVCGGVHWQALIGWMEAEGMAEDLPQPEWRETIWEMITLRGGRALTGVDEETRAKALARYAHVEEVFTKFVESLTREQILDGALAYKVPVLPVLAVGEVAEDEGLRSRGFWADLPTGPGRDPVRYPDAPFRLSLTPAASTRAAPLLGEHTKGILTSDLGLSDEEVAALFQEGTI